MKFSCESALLNSAINISGRAVASKSSIPALEGILLQAKGDQLTLTGYNLETGIQTSLQADIIEEGSLVLAARFFGGIIRSLPDDMVHVATKDTSVDITCGMSAFHIMGIDPDEFPELPTIQENTSLCLPQGKLKSMISQTIFAVSDNESRPIHTGALFETEQTTLTVVAVDGYRLALRRETLTRTASEPISFVVPGAALKEVERICTDSDNPAEITQGRRHILFQIGNTQLIARRLEGEFLNYKQTIPHQNAVQVTVDRRKLQICVERVSLIINDKLKSPLRCAFGDQILHITAKTAIGDASDSCMITGDGKNLCIGFNHRYLLDAIRAAPTPGIRLELNTPTSPCLLLPEDESREDFLYMVLPVRLKASESN